MDLVREPTRTYQAWLTTDLPDLHDSDDWDDAFGYVAVWVRCFDAPEVSVLVHVICPGAGQDHGEDTGWFHVG